MKKETRRGFLKCGPQRAFAVVAGIATITTGVELGLLEPKGAHAAPLTNVFYGARFGEKSDANGKHHYVEFDVFACYPPGTNFSIDGPIYCDLWLPDGKPFCGNHPLDSVGVDAHGHVHAGIRWANGVPIPFDPASWTLHVG